MRSEDQGRNPRHHALYPLEQSGVRAFAFTAGKAAAERAIFAPRLLILCAPPGTLKLFAMLLPEHTAMLVLDTCLSEC